MSSLLPFIPVRVNTEKQVWIWDTLRQALDTDELVYFPQDYASVQSLEHCNTRPMRVLSLYDPDH